MRAVLRLAERALSPMFNYYQQEEKDEKERQRQRKQQRRLRSIGKDTAKEQRDEFAESFFERVDGWMSKTADEVEHAGAGGQASDRQQAGREALESTAALGQSSRMHLEPTFKPPSQYKPRLQEPRKNFAHGTGLRTGRLPMGLGKRAPIGQRWSTEAERIENALAENKQRTLGEVTQGGAGVMRARQKHKEIQGPLKWGVTAQAERIEESIETNGRSDPTGDPNFGSQLGRKVAPVWRPLQPEKWMGGPTSRFFGDTTTINPANGYMNAIPGQKVEFYDRAANENSDHPSYMCRTRIVSKEQERGHSRSFQSSLTNQKLLAKPTDTTYTNLASHGLKPGDSYRSHPRHAHQHEKLFLNTVKQFANPMRAAPPMMDGGGGGGGREKLSSSFAAPAANVAVARTLDGHRRVTVGGAPVRR